MGSSGSSSLRAKCRLNRPFVIDLESTNGTYVNDQEIPKSRFVFFGP